MALGGLEGLTLACTRDVWCFFWRVAWKRETERLGNRRVWEEATGIDVKERNTRTLADVRVHFF